MAEVRPVHKQNNLRMSTENRKLRMTKATLKNFTQRISKDLCNLRMVLDYLVPKNKSCKLSKKNGEKNYESQKTVSLLR